MAIELPGGFREFLGAMVSDFPALNEDFMRDAAENLTSGAAKLSDIQAEVAQYVLSMNSDEFAGASRNQVDQNIRNLNENGGIGQAVASLRQTVDYIMSSAEQTISSKIMALGLFAQFVVDAIWLVAVSIALPMLAGEAMQKLAELRLMTGALSKAIMEGLDKVLDEGAQKLLKTIGLDVVKQLAGVGAVSITAGAVAAKKTGQPFDGKTLLGGVEFVVVGTLVGLGLQPLAEKIGGALKNVLGKNLAADLGQDLGPVLGDSLGDGPGRGLATDLGKVVGSDDNAVNLINGFDPLAGDSSAAAAKAAAARATAIGDFAHATGIAFETNLADDLGGRLGVDTVTVREAGEAFGKAFASAWGKDETVADVQRAVLNSLKPFEHVLGTDAVHALAHDAPLVIASRLVKNAADPGEFAAAALTSTAIGALHMTLSQGFYDLLFGTHKFAVSLSGVASGAAMGGVMGVIHAVIKARQPALALDPNLTALFTGDDAPVTVATSGGHDLPPGGHTAQPGAAAAVPAPRTTGGHAGAPHIEPEPAPDAPIIVPGREATATAGPTTAHDNPATVSTGPATGHDGGSAGPTGHHDHGGQSADPPATIDPVVLPGMEMPEPHEEVVPPDTAWQGRRTELVADFAARLDHAADVTEAVAAGTARWEEQLPDWQQTAPTVVPKDVLATLRAKVEDSLRTAANRTFGTGDRPDESAWTRQVDTTLRDAREQFDVQVRQTSFLTTLQDRFHAEVGDGRGADALWDIYRAEAQQHFHDQPNGDHATYIAAQIKAAPARLVAHERLLSSRDVAADQLDTALAVATHEWPAALPDDVARRLRDDFVAAHGDGPGSVDATDWLNDRLRHDPAVLAAQLRSTVDGLAADWPVSRIGRDRIDASITRDVLAAHDSTFGQRVPDAQRAFDAKVAAIGYSLGDRLAVQRGQDAARSAAEAGFAALIGDSPDLVAGLSDAGVDRVRAEFAGKVAASSRTARPESVVTKLSGELADRLAEERRLERSLSDAGVRFDQLEATRSLPRSERDALADEFANEWTDAYVDTMGVRTVTAQRWRGADKATGDVFGTARARAAADRGGTDSDGRPADATPSPQDRPSTRILAGLGDAFIQRWISEAPVALGRFRPLDRLTESIRRWPDPIEGQRNSPARRLNDTRDVLADLRLTDIMVENGAERATALVMIDRLDAHVVDRLGELGDRDAVPPLNELPLGDEWHRQVDQARAALARQSPQDRRALLNQGHAVAAWYHRLPSGGTADSVLRGRSHRDLIDDVGALIAHHLLDADWRPGLDEDLHTALLDRAGTLADRLARELGTRLAAGRSIPGGMFTGPRHLRGQGPGQRFAGTSTRDSVLDGIPLFAGVSDVPHWLTDTAEQDFPVDVSDPNTSGGSSSGRRSVDPDVRTTGDSVVGQLRQAIADVRARIRAGGLAEDERRRLEGQLDAHDRLVRQLAGTEPGRGEAGGHLRSGSRSHLDLPIARSVPLRLRRLAPLDDAPVRDLLRQLRAPDQTRSESLSTVRGALDRWQRSGALRPHDTELNLREIRTARNAIQAWRAEVADHPDHWELGLDDQLTTVDDSLLRAQQRLETSLHSIDELTRQVVLGQHAGADPHVVQLVGGHSSEENLHADGEIPAVVTNQIEQRLATRFADAAVTVRGLRLGDLTNNGGDLRLDIVETVTTVPLQVTRSRVDDGVVGDWLKGAGGRTPDAPSALRALDDAVRDWRDRDATRTPTSPTDARLLDRLRSALRGWAAANRETLSPEWTGHQTQVARLGRFVDAMSAHINTVNEAADRIAAALRSGRPVEPMTIQHRGRDAEDAARELQRWFADRLRATEALPWDMPVRGFRLTPNADRTGVTVTFDTAGRSITDAVPGPVRMAIVRGQAMAHDVVDGWLGAADGRDAPRSASFDELHAALRQWSADGRLRPHDLTVNRWQIGRIHAAADTWARDPNRPAGLEIEPVTAHLADTLAQLEDADESVRQAAVQVGQAIREGVDPAGLPLSVHTVGELTDAQVRAINRTFTDRLLGVLGDTPPVHRDEMRLRLDSGGERLRLDVSAPASDDGDLPRLLMSDDLPMSPVHPPMSPTDEGADPWQVGSASSGSHSAEIDRRMRLLNDFQANHPDDVEGRIAHIAAVRAAIADARSGFTPDIPDDATRDSLTLEYADVPEPAPTEAGTAPPTHQAQSVHPAEPASPVAPDRPAAAPVTDPWLDRMGHFGEAQDVDVARAWQELSGASGRRPNALHGIDAALLSWQHGSRTRPADLVANQLDIENVQRAIAAWRAAWPTEFDATPWPRHVQTLSDHLARQHADVSRLRLTMPDLYNAIDRALGAQPRPGVQRAVGVEHIRTADLPPGSLDVLRTAGRRYLERRLPGMGTVLLDDFRVESVGSQAVEVRVTRIEPVPRRLNIRTTFIARPVFRFVSDWRAATNAGRFTPRSERLRAIDTALSAWESGGFQDPNDFVRSADQLDTLRAAIENWQTNTRSQGSLRGPVDELSRYVADMRAAVTQAQHSADDAVERLLAGQRANPGDALRIIGPRTDAALNSVGRYVTERAAARLPLPASQIRTEVTHLESNGGPEPGRRQYAVDMHVIWHDQLGPGLDRWLTEATQVFGNRRDLGGVTEAIQHWAQHAGTMPHDVDANIEQLNRIRTRLSDMLLTGIMSESTVDRTAVAELVERIDRHLRERISVLASRAGRPDPAPRALNELPLGQEWDRQVNEAANALNTVQRNDPDLVSALYGRASGAIALQHEATSSDAGAHTMFRGRNYRDVYSGVLVLVAHRLHQDGWHPDSQVLAGHARQTMETRVFAQSQRMAVELGSGRRTTGSLAGDPRWQHLDDGNRDDGRPIAGTSRSHLTEQDQPDLGGVAPTRTVHDAMATLRAELPDRDLRDLTGAIAQWEGAAQFHDPDAPGANDRYVHAVRDELGTVLAVAQLHPDAAVREALHDAVGGLDAHLVTLLHGRDDNVPARHQLPLSDRWDERVQSAIDDVNGNLLPGEDRDALTLTASKIVAAHHRQPHVLPPTTNADSIRGREVGHLHAHVVMLVRQELHRLRSAGLDRADMIRQATDMSLRLGRELGSLARQGQSIGGFGLDEAGEAAVLRDPDAAFDSPGAGSSGTSADEPSSVFPGWADRSDGVSTVVPDDSGGLPLAGAPPVDLTEAARAEPPTVAEPPDASGLRAEIVKALNSVGVRDADLVKVVGAAFSDDAVAKHMWGVRHETVHDHDVTVTMESVGSAVGEVRAEHGSASERVAAPDTVKSAAKHKTSPFELGTVLQGKVPHAEFEVNPTGFGTDVTDHTLATHQHDSSARLDRPNATFSLSRHQIGFRIQVTATEGWVGRHLHLTPKSADGHAVVDGVALRWPVRDQPTGSPVELSYPRLRSGTDHSARAAAYDEFEETVNSIKWSELRDLSTVYHRLLAHESMADASKAESDAISRWLGELGQPGAQFGHDVFRGHLLRRQFPIDKKTTEITITIANPAELGADSPTLRARFAGRGEGTITTEEADTGSYSLGKGVDRSVGGSVKVAATDPLGAVLGGLKGGVKVTIQRDKGNLSRDAEEHRNSVIAEYADSLREYMLGFHYVVQVGDHTLDPVPGHATLWLASPHDTPATGDRPGTPDTLATRQVPDQVAKSVEFAPEFVESRVVGPVLAALSNHDGLEFELHQTEQRMIKFVRDNADEILSGRRDFAELDTGLAFSLHEDGISQPVVRFRGRVLPDTGSFLGSAHRQQHGTLTTTDTRGFDSTRRFSASVELSADGKAGPVGISALLGLGSDRKTHRTVVESAAETTSWTDQREALRYRFDVELQVALPPKDGAELEWRPVHRLGFADTEAAPSDHTVDMVVSAREGVAFPEVANTEQETEWLEPKQTDLSPVLLSGQEPARFELESLVPPHDMSGALARMLGTDKAADPGYLAKLTGKGKALVLGEEPELDRLAITDFASRDARRAGFRKAVVYGDTRHLSDRGKSEKAMGRTRDAQLTIRSVLTRPRIVFYDPNRLFDHSEVTRQTVEGGQDESIALRGQAKGKTSEQVDKVLKLGGSATASAKYEGADRRSDERSVESRRSTRYRAPAYEVRYDVVHYLGTDIVDRFIDPSSRLHGNEHRTALRTKSVPSGATVWVEAADLHSIKNLPTTEIAKLTAEHQQLYHDGAGDAVPTPPADRAGAEGALSLYSAPAIADAARQIKEKLTDWLADHPDLDTDRRVLINQMIDDMVRGDVLDPALSGGFVELLTDGMLGGHVMLRSNAEGTMGKRDLHVVLHLTLEGGRYLGSVDDHATAGSRTVTTKSQHETGRHLTTGLSVAGSVGTKLANDKEQSVADKITDHVAPAVDGAVSATITATTDGNGTSSIQVSASGPVDQHVYDLTGHIVIHPTVRRGPLMESFTYAITEPTTSSPFRVTDAVLLTVRRADTGDTVLANAAGSVREHWNSTDEPGGLDADAMVTVQPFAAPKFHQIIDRLVGGDDHTVPAEQRLTPAELLALAGRPLPPAGADRESRSLLRLPELHLRSRSNSAASEHGGRPSLNATRAAALRADTTARRLADTFVTSLSRDGITHEFAGARDLASVTIKTDLRDLEVVNVRHTDPAPTAGHRSGTARTTELDGSVTVSADSDTPLATRKGEHKTDQHTDQPPTELTGPRRLFDVRATVSAEVTPRYHRSALNDQFGQPLRTGPDGEIRLTVGETELRALGIDPATVPDPEPLPDQAPAHDQAPEPAPNPEPVRQSEPPHGKGRALDPTSDDGDAHSVAGSSADDRAEQDVPLAHLGEPDWSGQVNFDLRDPRDREDLLGFERRVVEGLPPGQREQLLELARDAADMVFGRAADDPRLRELVVHGVAHAMVGRTASHGVARAQARRLGRQVGLRPGEFTLVDRDGITLRPDGGVELSDQTLADLTNRVYSVIQELNRGGKPIYFPTDRESLHELMGWAFGEVPAVLHQDQLHALGERLATKIMDAPMSLRGGAAGLEIEVAVFAVTLDGTTLEYGTKLVEVPGRLAIVIDHWGKNAIFEVVGAPGRMYDFERSRTAANEVRDAVTDAVQRLTEARPGTRLAQIFGQFSTAAGRNVMIGGGAPERNLVQYNVGVDHRVMGRLTDFATKGAVDTPAIPMRGETAFSGDVIRAITGLHDDVELNLDDLPLDSDAVVLDGHLRMLYQGVAAIVSQSLAKNPDFTLKSSMSWAQRASLTETRNLLPSRVKNLLANNRSTIHDLFSQVYGRTMVSLAEEISAVPVVDGVRQLLAMPLDTGAEQITIGDFLDMGLLRTSLDESPASGMQYSFGVSGVPVEHVVDNTGFQHPLVVQEIRSFTGGVRDLTMRQIWEGEDSITGKVRELHAALVEDVVLRRNAESMALPVVVDLADSGSIDARVLSSVGARVDHEVRHVLDSDDDAGGTVVVEIRGLSANFVRRVEAAVDAEVARYLTGSGFNLDDHVELRVIQGHADRVGSSNAVSINIFRDRDDGHPPLGMPSGSHRPAPAPDHEGVPMRASAVLVDRSPAEGIVPSHQWIDRVSSALASRVDTEFVDVDRTANIRDPRLLNGAQTLIRYDVSRVETEPGSWARVFTVKLDVRADDGVSADAVAAVKSDAVRALAEHINDRYRLANGDQLHIRLDFDHAAPDEPVGAGHDHTPVSPAERAARLAEWPDRLARQLDQAHAVVTVHDGVDTNQVRWSKTAGEAVLLHEILHFVGLTDAGRDPLSALRHNLPDDVPPGLMGRQVHADQDPYLTPGNLDRIDTVQTSAVLAPEHPLRAESDPDPHADVDPVADHLAVAAGKGKGVERAADRSVELAAARRILVDAGAVPLGEHASVADRAEREIVETSVVGAVLDELRTSGTQGAIARAEELVARWQLHTGHAVVGRDEPRTGPEHRPADKDDEWKVRAQHARDRLDALPDDARDRLLFRAAQIVAVYHQPPRMSEVRSDAEVRYARQYDDVVKIVADSLLTNRRTGWSHAADLAEQLAGELNSRRRTGGAPIGAGAGIEAESGNIVVDRSGRDIDVKTVLARTRHGSLVADFRKIADRFRSIVEYVSDPFAVADGESGGGRPSQAQIRQDMFDVFDRLNRASSGTPFAEIFHRRDGYMLTNQGLDAIHQRRNHDNFYMQYNIGVPIAGMHEFTNLAKDMVNHDLLAQVSLVEISVRNMGVAQDFAGEVAARFVAGPNWDGQDPEGVLRDLPADSHAAHLRGFLLTLFKQGAALADVAVDDLAVSPDDIGLAKNHLLTASRMPMAVLRESLPGSVQQFLEHNAQHIRRTFESFYVRMRQGAPGLRLVPVRPDMTPAVLDADFPLNPQTKLKVGDYLDYGLRPGRGIFDNPALTTGVTTIPVMDTVRGLAFPPLAVEEMRRVGRRPDFEQSWTQMDQIVQRVNEIDRDVAFARRVRANAAGMPVPTTRVGLVGRSISPEHNRRLMVFAARVEQEVTRALGRPGTRIVVHVEGGDRPGPNADTNGLRAAQFVHQLVSPMVTNQLRGQGKGYVSVEWDVRTRGPGPTMNRLAMSAQHGTPDVQVWVSTHGQAMGGRGHDAPTTGGSAPHGAWRPDSAGQGRGYTPGPQVGPSRGGPRRGFAQAPRGHVTASVVDLQRMSDELPVAPGIVPSSRWLDRVGSASVSRVDTEFFDASPVADFRDSALSGLTTLIRHDVARVEIGPDTWARVLTVKLELRPGEGVDAATVLQVRNRAQEAVDSLINDRYRFDNGDQLHISLDFEHSATEDDSVVVVTVHDGADTDQVNWAADATLPVLAHEAMHFAGRADNYQHDDSVLRRGLDDAAGHGLMGGDVLSGRPVLTEADLDQIDVVHIGAGIRGIERPRLTAEAKGKWLASADDEPNDVPDAGVAPQHGTKPDDAPPAPRPPADWALRAQLADDALDMVPTEVRRALEVRAAQIVAVYHRLPSRVEAATSAEGARYLREHQQVITVVAERLLSDGKHSDDGMAREDAVALARRLALEHGTQRRTGGKAPGAGPDLLVSGGQGGRVGDDGVETAGPSNIGLRQPPRTDDHRSDPTDGALPDPSLPVASADSWETGILWRLVTNKLPRNSRSSASLNAVVVVADALRRRGRLPGDLDQAAEVVAQQLPFEVKYNPAFVGAAAYVTLASDERKFVELLAQHADARGIGREDFSGFAAQMGLGKAWKKEHIEQVWEDVFPPSPQGVPGRWDTRILWRLVLADVFRSQTLDGLPHMEDVAKVANAIRQEGRLPDDQHAAAKMVAQEFPAWISRNPKLLKLADRRRNTLIKQGEPEFLDVLMRYADSVGILREQFHGFANGMGLHSSAWTKARTERAWDKAHDGNSVSDAWVAAERRAVTTRLDDATDNGILWRLVGVQFARAGLAKTWKPTVDDVRSVADSLRASGRLSSEPVEAAEQVVKAFPAQVKANPALARAATVLRSAHDDAEDRAHLALLVVQARKEGITEAGFPAWSERLGIDRKRWSAPKLREVWRAETEPQFAMVADRSVTTSGQDVTMADRSGPSVGPGTEVSEYSPGGGADLAMDPDDNVGGGDIEVAGSSRNGEWFPSWSEIAPGAAFQSDMPMADEPDTPVWPAHDLVVSDQAVDESGSLPWPAEQEAAAWARFSAVYPDTPVGDLLVMVGDYLAGRGPDAVRTDQMAAQPGPSAAAFQAEATAWAIFDAAYPDAPPEDLIRMVRSYLDEHGAGWG